MSKIYSQKNLTNNIALGSPIGLRSQLKEVSAWYGPWENLNEFNTTIDSLHIGNYSVVGVVTVGIWDENKTQVIEYWNPDASTNFVIKHPDVATNASVEAKADELVEYVDNKITDLVGGAPETLDTLKELADSIIEHKDIYDAYVDTVYSKEQVNSLIGVETKTEEDEIVLQRVIPVQEQIESVKSWVEDKKYLSEHQSIDHLATKDELNALKIHSIDGLVSKEYVDNAIANIEHPTVDLSNLATKDELNALEIPSIDGLVTKEYVDSSIKDVVKFEESTPGRKHIVLANHDSIIGKGTDCREGQPNGYEGGEDLTGSSYNLVMLSKWNVADFGSSKIKLNLNSKEGKVFINDDKQVATIDQIPSINGLATEQFVQDEISKIPETDLSGHVTKDELEEVKSKVEELSSQDTVKFINSNSERKHILLANHDSIIGKGTDCREGQPNGYEGGEDLTGSSFNLVMLSKWNVADFGSSKIKLNLNSKDGKVFINDKKQVATEDYVDSRVTALIGTAPETLDTIQELAEAFENNSNAIEALAETYETKTTVSELSERIDNLESIDHSVYLTEHQDITGKQDVISDLDNIRSGAALGATALQEHQSLEGYVPKAMYDDLCEKFYKLLNKMQAYDDRFGYISIDGQVEWAKDLLFADEGDNEILFNIINGMGIAGNREALVAIMNDNDTDVAVLRDDIEIRETISINDGKTKEIKLNGQSIKNGHIGETNIWTSNCDAVTVNDGTLTISGNGKIETLSRAGSPIYAHTANATINIQNGFYLSNGLNPGKGWSLVYADGGAKINISGGYFAVVGKTDEKLYEYVLNCKDNSGSVITLTGGYFYEADPRKHDHPEEVVILEGYKVVAHEDYTYEGITGTWYEVVKDE